MKICWGIIGCGDVAERKGGPALYTAANSELVAVMRRDKEKAADFARRHGAKRFYNRVEDLIGDPEINAVYVATPPYVHAEETIQAAEAGKHVLCEKPMAMNVQEGEEMISACKANGVQLMIAYYRRRFPAALKVKELIEKGAIGQPIMARLQIASSYSPPTTERKSWRMDPKIAGGGLLADIGSHSIDLLHFWLGDVCDVAAFTDTVGYDVKVENSSVIILRFKDDVQATVQVNENVGFRHRLLEVGGAAGRVELIGDGAVGLETSGDKQVFDLPAPKITHLGIVENLIESINKAETNCLSGEEGLKTTKVLSAAYESSRKRTIISIR